MSVKDLIWVPRTRFGPFVFLSPFEQYVKPYRMTAVPKGKFSISKVDGWDWDEFETVLFPGLTVNVREGFVDTVNTDRYAYLDGVNLVGQSLETLVKMVGCQPEEHDTQDLPYSDTQDIYYFYSLGFEAWAEHDRIVSLTCMRSYDEDE